MKIELFDLTNKEQHFVPYQMRSPFTKTLATGRIDLSPVKYTFSDLSRQIPDH